MMTSRPMTVILSQVGNALDCEVSMGDYFTNTDLMMYFNKV